MAGRIRYRRIPSFPFHSLARAGTAVPGFTRLHAALPEQPLRSRFAPPAAGHGARYSNALTYNPDHS